MWSNGVRDAGVGLEWVRGWRRNVTRALELGVTVPDPMVLMGALSPVTEGLSHRSPQVAYRLNVVRQQLGVDVQSNFGAVWSFSEHLQAEAEELAVGRNDTGSDALGGPRLQSSDDALGGPRPQSSVNGNLKGSNPKPSVKLLQGPSGGSGNPPGSGDGKGSAAVSNVNADSVISKQVCRFWGVKDDGCHRADKCKFVHTMLSSKDNRCFSMLGRIVLMLAPRNPRLPR